MKLSTERILTTHVGSLPRPRSLLDLILAKEEGRPLDAAAFEAQSVGAVAEVVAKQVVAGIDIVSDGEMSKLSYGPRPNGEDAPNPVVGPFIGWTSCEKRS
jgi:5-methyltetrahydropteroyltriglutamate--homocysteine methyltransferase